MEILLKINIRTKAGKAFLQILEVFLEGKKGIEVVSGNIPNKETEHIFKENDKTDLKHLKKFGTAKELFQDLGV